MHFINVRQSGLVKSVSRWHAGSFYIYGCGDATLPAGLKANKAGGCTVTCKKNGGVQKAWALAKLAANYTQA